MNRFLGLVDAIFFYYNLANLCAQKITALFRPCLHLKKMTSLFLNLVQIRNSPCLYISLKQ